MGNASVGDRRVNRMIGDALQDSERYVNRRSAIQAGRRL